jgi:hypothetical protein
LLIPSSELFTPLPADGVTVVMSGGQAAAHAPVHALLVPVSDPNRYRVLPWESTRMVPRALLARSTVPEDALVGEGCADGAAPPVD